MRSIVLGIFLLSVTLSNGQSVGNWTEWITVYPGVQVSYKFSHCIQNGGESVLQGYSFYRTRNDTQRDKCWVFFSLEFAECNGSIKSENNLKIDLSKVGINEDRGQWFAGYKVTRSYFNVEYKDYNTTVQNNADDKNDYNDRNSQTQNTNYQAQQSQQQENIRRQQVQNQLNQIQRDYDANTQRIESIVSAFSGMVGQVQENMIQRNIQDLNYKREQRYNDLKSRLQDGGSLEACGACSGAGTVTCQKCYGSPVNTCSYCNGSGTMNSFGTLIACSFCSGTGKTVCGVCGGVGLKLCYDCFGAGYKIENSFSSATGGTSVTASSSQDYLENLLQSGLEYYRKGEALKSSDLQKAYQNWRDSHLWFYQLLPEQRVQTNQIVNEYTVNGNKAQRQAATVEAWKKAILNTPESILRIAIMDSNVVDFDDILDYCHLDYLKIYETERGQEGLLEHLQDDLWVPNELVYAATIDKYKGAFLKKISEAHLKLLRNEYNRRKESRDKITGTYTFSSRGMFRFYVNKNWCGTIKQNTGNLTASVNNFLEVMIAGDIHFAGSGCKEETITIGSDKKNRDIVIKINSTIGNGRWNFNSLDLSTYDTTSASLVFCFDQDKCTTINQIKSIAYVFDAATSAKTLRLGFGSRFEEYGDGFTFLGQK